MTQPYTGRLAITARCLRLATTALTSVAVMTGQGNPASAQTPTLADPPARVGRLASIQGDVSAHAADETTWTPAVRNDPVSSGQVFWSQPQALAELEVDASTLWLDGGTEFSVDHLDERHFAGTETQGETYLDLRNLAPGETYTVQTPRGLVSIVGNGRYDIVAGDSNHPTRISVFDGRAEVTGPTLVLSVPAGHTATITGAQTYLGNVGPLLQDGFVVAMMERERAPTTLPRTLPPAVAQMTGAEDLAPYGTWQTVPDYGEVWYPQVDAGWAPYRDGHWVFDAPWGWTWVDNAPWGFAPFHYGRWVEHENRWGWVPLDPGVHDAPGARPVYAPALVTFFGLGAVAAVGVGLAASAAFSHGNVGWLPLGPREPYYPPYRASERYLQRVNAPDVAAANRLNFAQAREQTIGRFANQAAVSVVPSEILTQSRPVATALQPARPAEFAAEHPVVERPLVAPGVATRGVTPAIARSFGLPAAVAPRPPAPGPAITPASLPPATARPPAAPELRPPGTAPRSTFPPAVTTAPPRPAPEVIRPNAPSIPHTTEAPRVEPPRAELPRVEAPRAELPRAELPRVGPPRAEPPRAELPRAEPPRAEPPRAELPRVEPPRAEPPRAEAPRAEPPRPEVIRPAAPRVETPRPEPTRAEIPRPEIPRPVIPRPEIPRPEIQRAAPPPHVEAPRPAAPPPRPPPHQP